jgi:hypothetical protein
MQSPDGLTALAVLPGMAWSWTNGASLAKIMEAQHCPPVDIDSAASFLVNIAVPNMHPAAKILEVLPLPPEGQASIAAQLQKNQEQNAAMARQYNQKPQKLSIDGARVRLQFVREGRTEEEQVVSVIDCFESQFPAMFNQPGYTKRNCASRSAIVTRAPQGHLKELVDSPQLASLYKSLQINPEWDNRVAQDAQASFNKFQAANNKQFQENMKASEIQHQKLLENGERFNANLKQGTDNAMAQDRARQNAIDSSAHATALASLDRQEFKNPATGQIIEASSQYNHQWISSDGQTLIQNNDHSFDPNGVVYPVSQSWTELVPK